MKRKASQVLEDYQELLNLLEETDFNYARQAFFLAPDIIESLSIVDQKVVLDAIHSRIAEEFSKVKKSNDYEEWLSIIEEAEGLVEEGLYSERLLDQEKHKYIQDLSKRYFDRYFKQMKSKKSFPIEQDYPGDASLEVGTFGQFYQGDGTINAKFDGVTIYSDGEYLLSLPSYKGSVGVAIPLLGSIHQPKSEYIAILDGLLLKLKEEIQDKFAEVVNSNKFRKQVRGLEDYY